MTDVGFILICGWMINRLHLSGNRLLVFATIHSFSQGTTQDYRLGIKYLMESTNAGRRTIIDSLKWLTENELIEKQVVEIGGVEFAYYSTAPLVRKLHQGGAETAPIKDAIKDAKDYEYAISRSEDKSSSLDISYSPESPSENGKTPYSLIQQKYNELCPNLTSCRVLNEKRKQMMQRAWSRHQEELFEIFRKANAQPFLAGDNDSGWRADIEFVLTESKIAKILEGAYESKSPSRQASSRDYTPGTESCSVKYRPEDYE